MAIFGLALMALYPARANAQNFRTGRMFSMPVHPNSVATGDFNEDGKLDLAIPSWSPNKLTIALGDGSGGIASMRSFDGSSSARFATVADFNADGFDDVATANETSGNVSIFLGDGLGGMTLLGKPVCGAGPYHLAAMHLNGDGILDLVVANSGADNVSILLGTGGGNFAAPTLVQTGASPHAVQPGDYNNDGLTDVAVSNWGAASVSILHGNGSGGFLPPVNFTVGANPFTLATGDLNNDGRLDLVVPNFGAASVSILLGHASLGFTSGGTIPVGAAPRAAILRDFSGDGTLDIAVANRDANSVSLLRGLGGATFTAAGTVGVGMGPFSLAAGDFDGDGMQDFASADRDGHTISIVKGVPGFDFNAPEVMAVGRSPRGVAAGDLNGDGLGDIVVVNNSDNNAMVLRSLGNGAFAAPVSYPIGSSPYAARIADVSGDGLPDVITANSSDNSVSFLRGTGGGAFAAHVKTTAGPSPRSLTIADFNSDGRPDVATANFGGASIGVLLGTGGGAFSPTTLFPSAAGPSGITSADLNGDGNIDVAVANHTAGTVGVFLGNGSGGFAPATFFAAGTTPAAIEAAHLNNDGILDLAVVNENTHLVTILFGTGGGAFGAPTPMVTGTRPIGLAIGDVTGDSLPDLIVAAATSSTISVHRNLGGGNFASAVALPAGVFSRSVALADLDGDTQLDLAVANSTSNDAWAILNRSGALADITLTVSNGASSVTRGQSTSYTFTVLNLGPTTVNTVILGINIPSDLQGVSISPSTGTFTIGSGAWNGLNLASGQSATLTVSGTISATATGNITVGGAVSLGSGLFDPAAGNNSASDTDTVIKGNADLSVTVSNGLDAVGAGDSVSYTIVVNNAGPTDVSGGTILVNLPAQLKNRVWSCSATGGADCVTDVPTSIPDAAAVLDEELEIPAAGQVTFQLTGTVDPLTPAGNLVLSASVEVPADVIDTNSGNDTATDSDPLSGNNAPVAGPQFVTVQEDSSLPIVLTGTDADNDSLTFSIESSPTHGTLSGTAPNVTYTPAANYSGPDSFTFKVDDGIHSSVATVSITVQSVNDAPTATGGSFVTNEDVAVPGVIQGSDPDGDSLTYTIVTAPTLGTVSGTFSSAVYTPNANVSGSDSFTYRISDGTVQTAPVTVTIQINAVNDAPTVVTPIADQTVNGEGISLDVSVAGTFDDVESGAGALVLTATSSDIGLATPTIIGNTVRLALNPNRGGTAAITVRAADPSGAFIEDTFNVTVTRPGSRISISDASTTEGASAGLVFTLSLTTPAAAPITVNWATQNGTAAANDYTAGSGLVTFAAGVTSRTIMVRSTGDSIDEENETVQVILSNPVGAVIEDGTGIGTIVDNDTAALRVQDITVDEGDVVTPAIFTITLTTASDRVITVDYSTADRSSGAVGGVDYAITAGTLTFPAGSTTPQTVNVDIIGDLLDENTEAFSFILSNPVNGTISRGTARANINDNDAPPSVSIADASVVEANSSTRAMTFNLTLSGPSGIRTRVRYATQDGTAIAGSDYTARTGEVVFDPGVTTRSITINTTGDLVVEADESFFVNLNTPTLLTIGDGQAVGTITNND